MNRKFLWLLTVFLVAFLHVAEAQQKKIPRLGYLAGTASSSGNDKNSFRERLRELSHI
jgi:hypothetical protein